MYRLTSLLILVPSLLAAQSDSAAIARQSRSFSAAYVANDSAALANVYADNGMLLPRSGDVRGRDSIAAFFRWGPNRRQVAHSMTSSELTIDGNLAVDIGTWSSTVERDGEQRTGTGRYLVVWQRQSDGSWKILYDMWH